MKKLTNKEKEIMDLYWKHGAMFVRELLDHYTEPKPHFNTLSTMVRLLPSAAPIVAKTPLFIRRVVLSAPTAAPLAAVNQTILS